MLTHPDPHLKLFSKLALSCHEIIIVPHTTSILFFCPFAKQRKHEGLHINFCHINSQNNYRKKKEQHWIFLSAAVLFPFTSGLWARQPVEICNIPFSEWSLVKIFIQVVMSLTLSFLYILLSAQLSYSCPQIPSPEFLFLSKIFASFLRYQVVSLLQCKFIYTHSNCLDNLIRWLFQQILSAKLGFNFQPSYPVCCYCHAMV